MTWKEHAACAHAVTRGYATPDEWFPTANGMSRKAREICDECPVRAECLQYAMASNARYGIWAGLTAEQRDKQRRQDKRRRSA